MLEVKGLSKKFDSGYVLKDIDLKIKDGEVYGIIGANGSGKSTFLNILNGKDTIIKSGGYEGDIVIDGKKVKINGHAHSVSCGIAMVHQELALFPGMRAVDNIKINRENFRFKLPYLDELSYVDEKKNITDAKAALERIGSDLDPSVGIDFLSLNQKQFVEIARELDNKNIRLLMLDEPTSSLNITETEKLLKCIREIAASGISVIFVSHRLEEIEAICDRVSVFRNGSLISTYKKGEFNRSRFAEDMVGQRIIKAKRNEKKNLGEALITYRNEKETENSLSVKKGEILGITGLAGQGQEQFLAGLYGLAATSYTAEFKGKTLKNGDTAELVLNDIYYLSENRGADSLLMDSSVWKNIVFGTEKKHPEFLLSRFVPKMLSFMNKESIKKYSESMINKLNIVCAGPEQIVRELSGGNQQKVCVARALTFEPELLCIGEPTRGIDIYSKELILKWILEMNRELQTTVIVSSGEIEELMRICDRIAVIYQGNVYKVFDSGVSPEKLTLALYGKAAS